MFFKSTKVLSPGNYVNAAHKCVIGTRVQMSALLQNNLIIWTQHIVQRGFCHFDMCLLRQTNALAVLDPLFSACA